MVLTLAALGPLEHDPDGVRRTARELLDGPPFSTEQPGPVTDVLQRIRGWVADVLDAMLNAVVGNQGLAWAVVGAATLVILLLVVRWGRHVRRDPGTPVGDTGPSRRTSGEWRADADAHADAGEWDAAIRCAYLALVSHLDEQGLLDDGRGLTVGEIDRLVLAAAPERANAVAAAGRAFEDTWYGHRPGDREGYARVLEALGTRRAVARS